MASIAIPTPVHAQVPAAGTTVAVRMIDTVDSSRDPASKQYRASVTQAVNAGNGVTIPQGALAAVTLVNSGNGWTTQLVSVTVNGQPVAVTSGSASVTGGVQSAAGNAVNSVNSVLGRFGHQVNPHGASAAIATGQRVVLPPGTALSFVLSQPPAANPAAAAEQPAEASAPPVAAAGQHWWMCRYQDKKDPSKPALGGLMYYAVVPASASFLNDQWKHFNAYVQQNYKIKDPNSAGKGFCRRVSDDAAGRAGSMDMFEKQWRSSNIEPIQVNYTNTPAQDAAIDAKLAGGAQPQPAPVGNSKECDYHSTCAAAPAAAPAQQTAAAPAPAPGGTSASRQPWYTLCRYQGLQDGHQIVYVTPFIHTYLAANEISDAFYRYMTANYDLRKVTAGSPGCSTKVSNSADQRTYTMQQLEKGWADSKMVVTHVDWTGTPAEIQATDAKLSAAQAALAVTPNEKYVYCMSGGSGPVVYFSDIFAAVPTSATFGPHAGRSGFPEFSGPFLAFLQKKYGYKSEPSSPVTCRAIYSPNTAGLQAAQATRQSAQDYDKQANKQIVETGWKE